MKMDENNLQGEVLYSVFLGSAILILLFSFVTVAPVLYGPDIPAHGRSPNTPAFTPFSYNAMSDS